MARPLIKPAVKALASAGLSFGAEKALEKIFGKGYGPKEIKLYKLVQKLTPQQKKDVEKYLTHWICCWKAKNGDHEYFDSFGLPPPDEWEHELKKMGKKVFFAMTINFSGLRV